MRDSYGPAERVAIILANPCHRQSLTDFASEASKTAGKHRPEVARGVLRVDGIAMTVAMSADLSSGAKPKVDRNRRRSERTSHTGEAWISSPTATDPADRVEVTTLDVSRHGVAFELQAPIPTGAYYILRFNLGSQKIHSEIRILSCRPGDESFRIGAEFC